MIIVKRWIRTIHFIKHIYTGVFLFGFIPIFIKRDFLH